MSKTLRMAPEKRARAGSAILKRWITDGTFYPNDEVCELVIDGKPVIVRWETDYPADIAGTMWAYVREGDEVGVDGSLLEYSTSGFGRDPRKTFIGDVDIRNVLAGGFTPSPSSLGSPVQTPSTPDSVAGESSPSPERSREILRELEEKISLRWLLERVTSTAHGPLVESAALRSRFDASNDCDAFVMSIDIRRSTELMLKARSAEHFATFMTVLCEELIDIIKGSYGVLDKFTGDGILAFFPDFFSGPDAAYRVVSIADQCHEVFHRTYLRFRRSFKAVLKDTGLGVGVDYGSVRIVRMGDGLTVLGEPVVYACRLSSAPAGITLFNQGAYERVSQGSGALYQIVESELEVKHAGRLVTYEVTLAADCVHKPAPPEWLESPSENP
jgi:class 3 adenylate cyclase